MTDQIKLTAEEIKSLPTKKWCKWATSVTGKSEMEYWLQGMFFLTEIKDLSQEEASKIMNENWDK